jgi:hypothetical protein
MCSINPLTNPNPVYSYSIKSWRYVYLLFIKRRRISQHVTSNIETTTVRAGNGVGVEFRALQIRWKKRRSAMLQSGTTVRFMCLASLQGRGHVTGASLTRQLRWKPLWYLITSYIECGPILGICQRGWRKPRISSVKGAGLLAEIWTRDLCKWYPMSWTGVLQRYHVKRNNKS